MEPPQGRFDGTLRPFQQRGLASLAANPRGLLADEMGLGKTVQALALLASTGACPALVVAPPHLLRNWAGETARFLRVPDGQGGARAPVIHEIRGLTPYDLPAADVYLTHYLLLRGWKKALPEAGFQALILDEVQELRRGGTEKYSAASLLAGAVERVIGLSGTPIYNRGGEIWHVINILDFQALGDWEGFTREWCVGYGSDVVARPELLGDHLRREGLMFRRTKAEVLPELPPKRRLVQEIDADDALYDALAREVLAGLTTLREDTTLTNAQRALLEEQVSQRERQATGLAKAKYVCLFARSLLEGGEAVLLFAHHHSVMDVYRQELAAFHPGFVTGRETAAEKDEAVRAFQTGKTRLCCISLRAAAGLNLQQATCVVFGELDWSPAVHSQAEDRAHRIGQEDSLLCYYLVSPRGSDADIQEALGLKISQFMGLMGEAPAPLAIQQSQANAARRHVERLMARLMGVSRDDADVHAWEAESEGLGEGLGRAAGGA
jgi:SNF2 family DNA or RNA helicase